MKIGDRVRITDFSDAHGDEGIIISAREGVAIVEVEHDSGRYYWPCHPEELTPIPE
jgi:hypothetical protein